MKRDLELIRRILLQAEPAPDQGLGVMQVEDFSDAVVAQHVPLLHDASFVAAEFRSHQPAVVVKLRMNGWVPGWDQA